ncbi:hypothetical protein AB0D71_41700 [Streptomyces avermitilis]|uniref:hypothetical protein n=1 Tax=Streptomyces avermitilis TaxID=33903 RepID=UPI0033F3589E
MAAHEASTWRRYAYALIVWLDLLRESALRRDVAFGDHKDLIEEFQARVIRLPAPRRRASRR